MGNIIIYNHPCGSVATVFPSGEVPIEVVATNDIPADIEYETVDAATLPADPYFRDAWTWAGKGQPVLEDLEKSKAIACEQVKTATRSEIKAVMEAELLGDPVVKTADQLRTDCSDVIEQINSASTSYEAKVLMCSYCKLPAPQQSSSN